jgi:hypothetical protein
VQQTELSRRGALLAVALRAAAITRYGVSSFLLPFLQRKKFSIPFPHFWRSDDCKCPYRCNLKYEYLPQFRQLSKSDNCHIHILINRIPVSNSVGIFLFHIRPTQNLQKNTRIRLHCATALLNIRKIPH